MTNINNLDRTIGRPNWTLIISLIVTALGIIFGVQQCRNNAITQGDLEARVDSLSFWKDKFGTEHAKVGQLVTSRAFVQKQLDSLRTIKGAKVTADVEVKQQGLSVLYSTYTLPGKPGFWTDMPGRWEPVSSEKSTWVWVPIDTTHKDTATYTLTAADTLDWLRHTIRTYASHWDTVKVTYDSATLVVNDKLHIVESQVPKGGLFNRKIMPYVDVYHENPMLRTTDVKAWHVSVPIKHWAVGPGANFYPSFDNGIKFGWSLGVSVMYTAIKF